MDGVNKLSGKYLLGLFFLILTVGLIIASGIRSFSASLRSPEPMNEERFFLDIPKQTTLVAAGDVMLGRFVNIKTRQGKDYRYPFLKTGAILTAADITFGNLESPMIANCPETATGMVFCAPSEAIEGLIFAGFDILSIANNHIYNYGKEGRRETIELLKQNGITSSFESLIIKEVNDLKFGFLSFDLTVNNRAQPVLDKVNESVPKIDILIVSLHWGNEYQKEPRDWQTALARQIIEAGARVIIGHHPHIVQPAEKYGRGLIFYSLGNFVFDQPWSEETKKGQIAKVVFTGKEIKDYELFPVYIKDSQPQLTD